MKQICRTIKSLKIIFGYEPLYFVFSLPQILISALLPLLYVYFPKLFIELLMNKNDYGDVVRYILLYCGTLLLLNLINSYFTNKQILCADRFIKKIRKQTGEITMSLPLYEMEGARFKERLSLANNATELTSIVGSLQKIVTSIITIVGLSVIIVRADIIFIMLVFISLSVKTLFTWLTYRYNKKRRKLYAENNRVGNYLTNTVYFNAGAAKEIRINNLNEWFMSKIKGFRNRMLELQYGDYKRGAILECITATIVAIQTLIVLFILAMRYTENVLTIADFTMYFSAVTSITTALSSIVVSIGEFNQQQLNISDFDELSICINNTCENSFEVNIRDYDIEFSNVSFRYPNSENYVLKNVSIKIPYGEKLSIVGNNGAGKSTFIKLICKFYKPTSGSITIGGVDIWEISTEKYSEIISCVFQDYQNLSFTIEENISMGRSKKCVESVIQEVGLEDVVDNLPNKKETYITRNFDSNGVELSGGESQKIAIARAIYKDTPILILDEPTAALDVKSEEEVYNNFLSMSQSKTSIFISHRMASSTVADKIVVFSDGRIVEYGNHRELREKKGLYNEMYSAQKKLFE